MSSGRRTPLGAGCRGSISKSHQTPSRGRVRAERRLEEVDVDLSEVRDPIDGIDVYAVGRQRRRCADGRLASLRSRFRNPGGSGHGIGGRWPGFGVGCRRAREVQTPSTTVRRHPRCRDGSSVVTARRRSMRATQSPLGCRWPARSCRSHAVRSGCLIGPDQLRGRPEPCRRCRTRGFGPAVVAVVGRGAARWLSSAVCAWPLAVGRRRGQPDQPASGSCAHRSGAPVTSWQVEPGRGKRRRRRLASRRRRAAGRTPSPRRTAAAQWSPCCARRP